MSGSVDRAGAAESAGTTRADKRTRRKLARKRVTLEAKLVAAERLISKRTRQLEVASARRGSLKAKLAHVRAAEAGDSGGTAYCLKEHRQVHMIDVRSVVLANGRPASSGTCASCGAVVMRLGS